MPQTRHPVGSLRVQQSPSALRFPWIHPPVKLVYFVQGPPAQIDIPRHPDKIPTPYEKPLLHPYCCSSWTEGGPTVFVLPCLPAEQQQPFPMPRDSRPADLSRGRPRPETAVQQHNRDTWPHLAVLCKVRRQ